MVQVHEFYAGMTCDGCKNAIIRIAGKIPGVQTVEADVQSKKVTVTGDAEKDAVLEKLQKWADASKKELKYVGTTTQ